MRKYVLTDQNGLTPKGQKLQPGKLIEEAHKGKDLLTRLGDCCCDDPLVAVLTSPLSTGPGGCRLFQINCWKVGIDPRQVQSYTVVKEVKPVPPVTLAQKISFALLVMREVYKHKDYAKWAEGWLAGRDRSLATAQTQRRAAEHEIQAAEDLRTLAAWGESGNDVKLAARLDHLTHAALHIARAAEYAAHTPPEVGKASQELARGLARVFQSGQEIDLALLAKKAVGGIEFVPERAAEH